ARRQSRPHQGRLCLPPAHRRRRRAAPHPQPRDLEREGRPPDRDHPHPAGAGRHRRRLGALARTPRHPTHQPHRRPDLADLLPADRADPVGLSGGMRKLGASPRTPPGGAAPWTPAKGGALRTLLGLWERVGQPGPVSHLVGPPSPTNQVEDSKGSAFGGVQGQSPWRVQGRALAFLLLLISVGPARAVERVVSLNLCSDQLLVMLAPEKVAGLTILARDPSLSVVAAAAGRLPVVRADAEAVLRARPDLVLAEAFGAQTTVALLRELGVRVLSLGMAQDFPAIRAQIRQVAAVLGVGARGEALIARMDATLAGVR